MSGVARGLRGSRGRGRGRGREASERQITGGRRAPGVVAVKIDSVQKNMPLIRNNLLLLMSNRNYQSLMSREGKEKLRAEALAEIKDVEKKQGSADVDDVLFTSFVVQ